MKFYRWLIVSMLLCCTQLMWAENCEQCYSCDSYNFCESCPSGMGYSVYLDYLYWKPFRSGILRLPAGEGDLFLNPTYSSGCRVEGRMSCNCVDLGVRYTFFDSTTKDSSLAFEGTTPIKSRYDVDFQAVDIEVGYAFCFDCENSFFRPFVGGKLVWIDEKIVLEINNTSFIFTDGLKFDDRGYGPYIGAEGRLQIFDCIVPIGLRARGSLGLLNSTHGAALISNTRSIPSLSRESHLVVVYEVFAGLDFSYCSCSCFDVNLAIGYELQSFIRDTVFLFSNGVPLDDFGLGGLVVRFGVCF